MSKVIQFPKPKQKLHIDWEKHTTNASPHFKRPNNEDFGDRMARIRESLDKINKLMAELKGRQAYNVDRD